MSRSESRLHFIFFVMLNLCAASGCNRDGASSVESKMAKPVMQKAGDGIAFHNDAKSNAEPSAEKFDLEFTDLNGDAVNLQQFRGQKNVVLVVTRGFSGMFCPFCTAQTSRLIRNHTAFAERNAEVVVVYPGDSQKANEFVGHVTASMSGDSTEIPFSIVLDEDFMAVDKLMIRGDLAKPSTYILDKGGEVRFAYVGRTASDRPSLKAMLAQLDRIEQR